tara:strand:+ start:201 stop:434 length:234 start_codon:yes stop_codon:yes gene_type:complete
MNLKEFIEKFAYQFDETPIDDIEAETVYEDLEEWSSLIALSVIAMVDQEYNVGIGAKEIIESITVEGLFNTIKQLRQ